MNVRLGTILAVTVFSLGAGPTASAHIDLNYPIGGNSNQKVGPCGSGDFDTGMVTTLVPGSELAIQIKETIGHPGHVRVMFDADTTDGLDFPPQVACDDVLTVNGTTVLADNLIPASGPVGSSCYDFHIPSERVPVGGTDYTLNVTLPNIECENCAIQVTQVMTDIGKQDANGNWDPAGGKGIYFRCAQVRLSNNAVDPDAGSGSPADAGVAGEDASGADDDDDDSPVGGGGCSTGGNSGATGLAFFALALFAIRRRQHQ